jgi:mannose-6-phosphate isomerase-like protein (cupin superfamily)
MAVAGRVPGLSFIIKVGATETLGAYSVFETMLPSGFPGPKPHTHTAEEAWYVIEGTLRFSMNERDIVAEAGSFVLAPRGARHSFISVGDGPVKMLTIFSPPRDALWTAVSEMREAAGDASLDIAQFSDLYKEHGEDLAGLGQ